MGRKEGKKIVNSVTLAGEGGKKWGNSGSRNGNETKCEKVNPGKENPAAQEKKSKSDETTGETIVPKKKN